MIVLNYFTSLLDKGIEFCVSDNEKKLVRTQNFMNYSILLLIIPMVVIYNIWVKDFIELIILLPAIFLGIWLLRLNQIGKSQLAITISALFYITITYPIIYLNASQMGAPYVCILLSFLAVVFIENSFWRNTIFIYGFITFILTNTFQLINLPFNMIEHIIANVFVLLIFIVFKYVGVLQNKYEKQLQEQNLIIKTQADELIKVQNEKHKSELKVKQSDLELVVANNSAQVRIKENLIEKLRNISDGKNVLQEVKRIILELKQQIESQKKIGLLQESINEVNTLFFQKLLEHAPNLSKTEQELCVYIKLSLSTKEIAGLKNTSSNTINVTKTRLRNKLGLENNAAITSFLRKL